MTVLSREQAARVARLARLELAPEELDRLAPMLEAITRDFSSLAAYAATLPPDGPPASGAPRADDVESERDEVVADILRETAGVDRDGAVRVTRA